MKLATVQKIITEILHADSGMTFAKETRDLLIECCVEFIRLISSEANEIAEKEAKKTIACEHVKAALEELGFGDYIGAISGVASDYRKQQVVCPSSCFSGAVMLQSNVLTAVVESGEEAEQDRAKRNDGGRVN